MKKLEKKDYLNLTLLITFIISYVLILYIKGYIFGSAIDWANQHILVPEYFRELFYKTGKILPSLALNLGMGQNIYYFSYYGLLSPIILLSYLLPFIPMYVYIPIISIISLIASTYLFYIWIKDKYNSSNALITTIIFMLNATFIYHFHRHIMFVIYMPFLLLAFKSVDLYFSQNKKIPLIITTFLMIMTSYYFSVFGIISIGVYTLSKILKNKKFNWRPLGSIIYLVSIAILLSAVLLVPTIYAISTGRADTSTTSISLLSLFSLKTNYNYTFYSSYYSWGITFIYIVAIVNAFLSKKKDQIFLSIIMTLIIIFPIFSYLLNALMYIDGKCYIPFIPLALLLVSELIKSITESKISWQKYLKILIPISIILIICGYGSKTWNLLITDCLLMLITIILSSKIKRKYLLFIPTIIISFISFYQSASNETYITKTDLENVNNNAYYELANIEDTDNLYRLSIEDNKLLTPDKVYNSSLLQSTIYSSTSNKYYLNFIRNIFQNEIINRDNTTITQTSNILFNIYSGTKYLISSEEAPIGYEEVKTIDGITLYKNDDVLPIGYATNKVMSKREFDTLEYPYTLDALLNYVIVDQSIDNVYESNINVYKTKYQITDEQNLTYEIENGHYLITADNNASLKIKLNTKIENQALIIKFKMNETKEGFACSSDITINGITNSLSCSNWKYNNQNETFEYVLSSSNLIDELNISLTKGTFDISDIELYTMDYNVIENLNDNIDELIIDQEKSSTNKLYGTINASNDGYVKLTIPYEKKGFKIYVDGEKVSKVMTDETFLGFEISAGTHNIEIVYKTPYLKLGIILSLIGIIFFILTIIYPKIKKHLQKLSNYLIKFGKYLYTKIKKFVKNNQGYILLFFSLYILDLALRIFYNQTINFYHWYKIVPNLFSAIWITFILYLTKLLKNKIGKTIYLIFYIFSFIMFLVQAIYFSYFNTFFDYSVLALASEGTAYLDSVLLNIKIWVIIISIISVFLTIKGLKLIKHNPKFKILNLIISIIIFIALELSLPMLLGQKNKEVEWDDWRNARGIYTSFNDNNKSMMVAGLFEYNYRNFYVNYLKNTDELTDAEKEVLEENFSNLELNEANDYTGVFSGKNLILVQLESIDEFLLDKNIMPNFYNISKNSINFTNHYSFTSGGGSTFNSEFMVNTGYSSAYNYNQSAYVFSRNTYSYSLANLFKNEGYTVNAFHMNTSEYYSRGVNYKAFGYDSYNGLKDLNIYENNEYWLDTTLINNETFNEKIFNTEKPFVSYLITYSAHMPYKTTKGTCPLLTDETGLTEYECLKIQAKETDDFIKLIFDNLEEKNLIDNTVVVLFTDHYVYTLENKSILDDYKETSNNLINHTPFMIYSNNELKFTVKDVNSQLDILPTILNLFGIPYYPNNYIGRDILAKDYDPLVFFPDGSWYNGSTYVANGEYQSGKKISTEKLEEYNLIVKRKMLLNDAVIKSDYFAKK